MDRLDAMHVFQTVVEMGSFSAASRKLGMPLPTVSRKVGELEQHLKAQLLTRSTRRLALTDTGATFLAASRRVLEALDEAERVASGEYTEPRGDLVITAPVAFGRLHVLPVLCEFLGTYPQVNVRIGLSDSVAKLLDEHIDLAVRIGPLPDTGMISKPLGEVRRVVCGSAAYFERHGIPQVPGELIDHACIGFDAFDAGYGWRFRTAGGDLLVPIRPRLVVNSAEAAVDAAAAGAGLASVLSYQVEPAMRQGRAELILRAFEPPPLPVHFVLPGRGRLTLKVRAWLDFATPRLRQRLADTAASCVAAS